MHPYIEILFSLILMCSGIILLRKFASLKQRQKVNMYKTFAAREYNRLLSRKIAIRLTIIIFVLGLVITSLMLIENGMMTVVWNY